MIKTIIVDEKETELEVSVIDNSISIQLVFLGNREDAFAYSHIDLSVDDTKQLIEILKDKISEISN